MRYIILSLIITLYSCQSSNENESILSASSSPALPTGRSIEECLQDTAINMDLLKLNSIKNLNVYNGIKFLKLGTHIDLYRNCLSYYPHKNNIDTGYFQGINFLSGYYEALVYFINDTLSRITLTNKDEGISDAYEKLKTIFGPPNLQKPKIIRFETSSDTYTILGTYKWQVQPYSENAADFIKMLEGTYYLQLKQTDFRDPFKDPNAMYENAGRNLLKEGSKKVRIQFLPYISIQAIWGTDILLKFNLTKQSKLLIGTGHQLVDNNPNALYEGYKVTSEYTEQIDLFRNKKTFEFFDSVLLSRIKEVEIKSEKSKTLEEKKVLKEF